MQSGLTSSIYTANSLEKYAPKVIYLSFIITTIAVCYVLYLLDVGFDLTDEGYYLNWISNPWLYKYYVSQFGYIYHPIYKLFGDSLVSMRLFNVATSYGLSWLLCYFLLRENLKSTSLIHITASACLALPALFVLMSGGRWLPSPSYNSLNFLGCLITALGFLISLSNQIRYRQTLASLFVGMGGWLIFMAKPSTAMMMAVLAVVFFVSTIKKDYRILLGATVVSIGLVLLSAFYIDGSILEFVRRYEGGLLFAKTLGAGHEVSTLLRLDLFTISTSFKIKVTLISFLILIGLLSVSINSLLAKKFLYLYVLIIFLYSLASVNELIRSPTSTDRYHNLVLTSFIFASVIFFTIVKKTSTTSVNNKLILLFLLIPYIYAAGTGNNYWKIAIGASVFWVLSGILIIAKKQFNLRLLSICVLSVTLISVVVITDSLRIPYRQSEPITNQIIDYKDLHSNNNLKLSRDTARYLNQLDEVLTDAHYLKGTPVIDLTGHHPGALYFMQAKAVGQAWTIGGYKGSELLASLALNQVSCKDIASAWLIIEVNGRRSISEKVLINHGVNVTSDTYHIVGELPTQNVIHFGKSKSVDGVYLQRLLRPEDVLSQTRSCETLRANKLF